MVEMTVVYEGGLHCRLTHGPSKSQIVTDAPVDNHGKGEAFSPTDLVGAALGACMITVMGIVAERHKIDLAGAQIRVVKEMASQPARRIGKLEVHLKLPKTVPEEKRKLLEQSAMACPVHASLHPAIEIPVTFDYSI